MAITDEMVVKFSADISDLKAGLDDVKRQIGDVGESAKAISLVEAGESIKSVGRDLTSSVTAPILGFFSESVKGASSTNEAIAKFKQIFKELAPEGESWISDTAKEMSRSESQVRDYAASFGAILSPQFEDNREKTLELSESYTQLAVDLAAFFDTTDDEAMQALMSGLSGQVMPLRRFGVLLSDAALNQELLNMGVEGGTKNATEAQKQLARHNFIMRMTVDAQGAAVRESDSFAQSMKRLEGTIDSIKVSVGNALMPVVLQIVGMVQGFLDQVRNLDPSILRIIVVLAGLVAAVGPVLIAVGTLVGMFGSFLAIIGTGGVMAGVTALIGTLAPLVVPVLAVIAAVGLLVGAFVGMYQASESFRTALGSVLGLVVEFGKGVIAWLMPIKDAVIAAVMPAFKALGDVYGSLIQKITDWIRGDGRVFIDVLGEIAGVVRDVLLIVFQKLVAFYTDYLLPVFAELAHIVLDYVLDALTDLAKWFKDPATQDGFKRIAERVGDIYEWLGKLWTIIKTHVLGPLGDFFAQFDPKHESWITGIIKVLAKFWDAGDGIAKLLRGDVVGAFDSFQKALFGTEEQTGATAKAVDTDMKAVSKSTRDELKAAAKEADENAKKIKDNLLKQYKENVKNVDEQMEKARKGMDNTLGLTAENADTRGKEIKDNLLKQYEANVKNADREFDDAKKKIEAQLVSTDQDVAKPKGLDIKKTLNDIWIAVKQDVSDRWTEIKNTVGEWMGTVRSHIDSFKQAFRDVVGGIWNAIKDDVGPYWEGIISAAGRAAQGVYDKINGILSGLIQRARDIWNDVKRTLSQSIQMPEIKLPEIKLPDLPAVIQAPVNPNTGYAPAPITYSVSPGFIPSHHTGGVYRAPGGRDEGLAWLQSGERVVPKHEVEREPREGHVTNITINNPSQKSARETLVQANSASRRIVRRIGVPG